MNIKSPAPTSPPPVERQCHTGGGRLTSFPALVMSGIVLFLSLSAGGVGWSGSAAKAGIERPAG